ncbi:MAG: DUF3798 domain-containing protein [Clostridiales bacterium]|nr:DUF3798 domain-containing protein [Clostridiales bacterium]
MMVEKYDASKIVHETWPDNFMQEQEQMISIVARLGSDPDIKAIIINQAVPGCNPAIDKLKETRDDIFIVYCTPQEDPPAVAERANIIIMPDELSMGPVMVAQAAALGAKTFVHYSFPRHMSQPLLSGRRNLIRENCEALGLKFVDATAPDPTGESGLPGAQQFILEDVPKMVAEYGKDTAFFSTNCSMQIPLITKVVDEGAIYPQPCCPSPYHGFPTALGIESPDGTMGTVDYIVAETTKKLDAAGVLGRLSTWPVPAAMMSTVASTEYAVKWINGEVQKDGVDMAALAQCMKEYAGVDIDLETYDNIDNFIVFLMGYLTYGV